MIEELITEWKKLSEENENLERQLAFNLFLTLDEVRAKEKKISLNEDRLDNLRDELWRLRKQEEYERMMNI